VRRCEATYGAVRRTGTAELASSDWRLGGGNGEVAYGNRIVARTPCRNVAGADRDEVVTYVFATAPFTAPDGKHVASVTLPHGTDLHVFTLATG
jgi:hypothetical protein